MIRLNNLKAPLGYDEARLRALAAGQLGIAPERIAGVRLAKKSVDARNKSNVHFVLCVDLSLKGSEAELLRHLPKGIQASALEPAQEQPPLKAARPPQHRPLVVGMGPAGLFAALTLAEAGLRPLVVERGRRVEERAQDVSRFWAGGALSPESNVQFGEGGAGAFSDGKLTTGISDPRCERVLRAFVACGAPEEILYLAKPHIGTDRLPGVVSGLRQRIEALGGTVLFEHRLQDLAVEDGRVSAARLERPSGEVLEVATSQLVLAVGHSARDTFAMLAGRGAPMVQKAFSIGARIEHRQRMVDESQYGRAAGHPALGAADYKLSCHLPGGRSVYTFCMCPGGSVVNASSEQGGLVTNGMSRFARDGVNANSALLVGVGPEDFEGDDPLAGVRFQQKWERLAFEAGGSGFRAPAQLVGDFLAGRPSRGAAGVAPSFQPGVTFGRLADCLPDYVCEAMAQGLTLLGRRLRGFDSPEAVLTGVETRSSSPLRILRDAGCQSALRGLFPAGEGAGYAGGILSAAVDGIRCAEALIASLE